MPRTTRKRSRVWRFLRQPIGPLQKKLGIFGTRGGALGVISVVGGIFETSWLRWFSLVSVASGLLLAWIFRRSHPDIESPPSIVSPRD